jgi:hypothetical protein
MEVDGGYIGDRKSGIEAGRLEDGDVIHAS